MSLAIFGGTFDPVHVGHLAVFEAVRDRFRLDRMLLLPARQPPHKGGEMISPFRHRLAMAQLACGGRPWLEVSGFEGSRPGPSYTVETLEHFRTGMDSQGRLFFVMGADSLADLPTWREPARILMLANIIVAPRPGIERSAAVASLDPHLAARIVAADDSPATPSGSIYWMEMPRCEVSGCAIRRRVRSGRTISGLVPDPVAEYIFQHRLYGGQED